jgi:hypothetical protein
VSFPAPKQGLVIRFSFLWSHERDAGATEASKDRPCTIVIAATRAADGEISTIVAPITHSPPGDPLDSVEIPASVCRNLGLDSGRHWIRLDEMNRFIWPGYDLPQVPGRVGEYAYGLLPPDLFEQVRKGILARQAAKKLRIQPRDA